jgi:DNA-binding response OmpR family regulator
MENKFSVLIVDDAKDTLFILEKALSKNGFKVSTAENVIDAVEIMKKNSFDLVISDINMPEINGLDFLFWIQENSPKTKVILVTSLSFDEIKSFVTRSSIIYFEKPIKPKELIKYINENLINKSFYGDIKSINIIDLLKILIMSGKNRLLEIKDACNKIGKVYVKNSNIIHAEYNNISGEIALFNIVKIKNGSFRELKWEEPEIITIDKPFLYLLSEANKILFSEDVSNKVLIVDDDIMTVLIIEKYLKEKGFNVTGVNSAIEGIELLKKENFGFIISDINMPEINGLEFLIWIREYSPYSRVIIITALNSDEIKNFATSKGILGYFNKPVSLKELEQFIRSKQEDSRLEGSVLEIDLIQFIEMLVISNKSNVIKVFEPIKNKKGEIYIKEGKIVHAVIDDKEGEEAFYEIIKLKSGLFSDEKWYEPEYYSVYLSNSDLLKNINENTTDININSKQLVKSRSKVVQKALNKKKDLEKFLNEKDELKKLTIYTSGVALGLVLGKTNKYEAVQQLKKFSKSNLDNKLENKMIIADDITVTLLFNDNNILEEITFGKNYRGLTEEGIGIGDTLEKVILTYGKPKVCTIRGAVWDNMAFFSNDNRTVSSIKIKNAEFFDSTPSILKSDSKIK